jgi:hypothetical protein
VRATAQKRESSGKPQAAEGVLAQDMQTRAMLAHADAWLAAPPDIRLTLINAHARAIDCS